MISINRESCIGCGACAATCPDVFEIRDGKAEVISQENSGCARTAAEGCPVQAISA